MNISKALTEPTDGVNVFTTCRARTIIFNAGLDEETRDSAWEAVDSRRDFNASQVSRILVRNKIPVSATHIQRHRRGDCACEGN